MDWKRLKYNYTKTNFKLELSNCFKLIAFFFAFFATHAYGLNQFTDTSEDELFDEEVEVVDDAPNQSLESLSLPGFYPEFDFYYNWDTNALDPYRFNVRNFNHEIPVTILHSECNYVVPIVGRLNSGFGWRGGIPHQGIDLQLRTGDSVAAAFDGVVRMSRWYSGYGNCVIVRHYNGFETLYGHLSQRYVKPGQLVNAGEVLGLGGSTGRSTGPHLHFETRFLGRPINPMRIIDFKGDSLVTSTLMISKNTFNLPYSKSNFKFKKGKRKWKKRGSRYKNKKIKPNRRSKKSAAFKNKKSKKSKSSGKKSSGRKHTFAYPSQKHCIIEFTV